MPHDRILSTYATAAKSRSNHSLPTVSGRPIRGYGELKNRPHFLLHVAWSTVVMASVSSKVTRLVLRNISVNKRYT